MLLHDRGLLAEAAAAYQDLLTHREEDHFTSVNEGVRGHLARYNLGRVCQDLGDLDQAVKQWQLILAEHPNYQPARLGLEEARCARGGAPR